MPATEASICGKNIWIICTKYHKRKHNKVFYGWKHKTENESDAYSFESNRFRCYFDRRTRC